MPTSTPLKYEVLDSVGSSKPLPTGWSETRVGDVFIRYDANKYSLFDIRKDFNKRNNLETHVYQGNKPAKTFNKDTGEIVNAQNVKLGEVDTSAPRVGDEGGGGKPPPPEPPSTTNRPPREPTPPPEIQTGDVNLPGLRDRQTVATGGNAAANRVSQAAADARSRVGGVSSAPGNFGATAAGPGINTAVGPAQRVSQTVATAAPGTFNTDVGGARVTASIRQRSAISTDVGSRFQLEQLKVNQDLEGRAAEQSTAAHGITADLPGFEQALGAATRRGQTRGRGSTILTRGGQRGLANTTANTLGRRRLTSGQPASPAAQTRGGEAAATLATTAQRQGVAAEQDRGGPTPTAGVPAGRETGGNSSLLGDYRGDLRRAQQAVYDTTGERRSQAHGRLRAIHERIKQSGNQEALRYIGQGRRQRRRSVATGG